MWGTNDIPQHDMTILSQSHSVPYWQQEVNAMWQPSPNFHEIHMVFCTHDIQLHDMSILSFNHSVRYWEQEVTVTWQTSSNLPAIYMSLSKHDIQQHARLIQPHTYGADCWQLEVSVMWQISSASQDIYMVGLHMIYTDNTCKQLLLSTATYWTHSVIVNFFPQGQIQV